MFFERTISVIIFARKIALVNVALMCWQAIADSHTPASGRNVSVMVMFFESVAREKHYHN